MKNFKKVIVSILAVVMLVSIVVCFSGCGDESKENTQVETTEVVTTVVSTTATPITIAPTTIKPTEQPTTTKATEISNDEAQEDNEDNEDEDGSWSYNDSNNSSSNGDMDSNDYYLDSNMNPDVIYSPDEFQTTGVVGWGGYEWTYYSELILPGEGLDIPGRYTTEDGYVCDGDGYVVLAADLDMLPRYSVVETPFGYTGKIYDTGCAYGTLDVYVGW